MQVAPADRTVGDTQRRAAAVDLKSADAGTFGGGGHPAASGANIEGSLEAVSRDVLTRTKEWLAAQRASRPASAAGSGAKT